MLKGNVLFDPWTGLGCMTDCYSNVLFLPGLEASRLYWRDPNCVVINCENQLWLANSDVDSEKLYLNPDGTSKLSNVYTSASNGAIDEAALPGVGVNIYKTFLSNLKNWKESDHIIGDYAVVPYDWRLSVDDVLTKGVKSGDNVYFGVNSGTYILDELLRMASSSNTGKVTIIAHSNGGLVAKRLMLKLREIGREDLVDKLVLVAVPQIGTPKAAGGLLHGSELGISGIIDNQHARTLGENMPSAYALLPSKKYFETIDIQSIPTELVTFSNSTLYTSERAAYGGNITNENELSGYLLGTEGRTHPQSDDLDSPNVLNSSLFNQATILHDAIDDWQPATSTQVIEIAGWGVYTVSGVSYYTEQKRDCVTVNDQFLIGVSHQECGAPYEVKKYNVKHTQEGDGTVVVPSALWMSTTPTHVERYWVDLMKYNKGLTIDRDHKNILEVIPLIEFIQNEISDSVAPLPDSIFDSATSLSVDSDVHYIYTLHSPLSLDLYDEFGNHTGVSTTSGRIEENIPDSHYDTFGELKYIIANGSQDAKLTKQKPFKRFLSESNKLISTSPLLLPQSQLA
jgi:pimeloyl-ACP methyl ester carboxylesterase